ncbi:MAG: hypothetical protein M1839_004460 [Geoglossum umbratile]|nr:MAG: hypothetical protein M1839_004460 [Geoglossum umbratile]
MVPSRSVSILSRPSSLIARVSFRVAKPIETPEVTEGFKTKLKLPGIQKKGLDLAAFSPMAEFAVVVVGYKLDVFSWEREADLRWIHCWTKTVLCDCVKASRMVDIALSNSLVAVAAESGFEVYELRTPGDENQGDLMALQGKNPVIQELGVQELTAIALTPETPQFSGWICAGTGGGELLIWDFRPGGDGEGQCILTPQPPNKLPSKKSSLRGYDKTAPDVPSAVAFSRNSSQICVGSRNRHIYIYKLSEDRWLLDKEIELTGKFVSRPLPLLRVAPTDGGKGGGMSQFVHFTGIAFLSADHISITTSSRFSGGCPAIFDMRKNARTVLTDETKGAQSLAVSPSKKRLVFVDNDTHTVMLVESSPGGIFGKGISVTTRVTQLGSVGNPFIAALTFTQLRLEDGSVDGRERFLVMDRMGTIQLFSCKT